MTAAAHTRPGGRELIQATVDEGSFRSWDAPIDRAAFEPSYQAELSRAELRSGVDEAVLTGGAAIRGHPVGLIVSEFGFLGGSIGVSAAARIVSAVRRATAERLPLIAATSSGGTRMQEGTPAFVQMIEITRAVMAHKSAGLPYLVYLRHPTTGGVFASWGSLGHVCVAEPGALIGFLGPTVYEALHGAPFPEGIQLAEHLVAKGIVDATVDIGQLADVAARALTLLSGRPVTSRRRRSVTAAPAVRPGLRGPADAWPSIELTRRADRPGVRELLKHAADDVIPLGGTQFGEREESVLVALTSLLGAPVVLVGQDRRPDAVLGPAGLRVARRGMALAQQLRLPLVCVIDTPGAELSARSEEGALAGEIARCIADLVALTVPTVSVILGQGAGGGALALLAARRVIAAEHAWLAPLPPEGASAIMHGGAHRAPEMAGRQRVRSADLLADGTIQAVVAEDIPAHLDPAGFASRIAAECVRQITWQR